MGLESFFGAGVIALITGVITAFFTYKQATKVADAQASSSIGVRRLENEGNLQSFFHEDLKSTRDELKNERAAHLECIKTCAKAESECKRLSDENAELERENSELRTKNLTLDHENRQIQTKLLGFEWINRNPALLRQRADEIEREKQNAPKPDSTT